MGKPVERDRTSRAEQSEDDVASMLKKMQRQLLFLEKKIDSLTQHLLEKQHQDNSSMDRSFPRRSHSKPSSGTEHPRGREKKRHKAKSEEKDSVKPFYSKFRKTTGASGSGSRKKPTHGKSQKRK